jgi:phage tail sheath protein FI
LFLNVGRWLEHQMAGYVFEPHTPALRARIERDLTFHFEQLHRQGALAGESADEAFYVKCDAETNPAEVREAGQIVAEVGLAASAPCEFIIVRIVQDASGLVLQPVGVV